MLGNIIVNIGAAILFAAVIVWHVWSSLKLYKNGQHRYYLNAIPGICTSLGILGTFVSIYFSLKDIKAEDINLITIIHELIPAFTTSICGIILAIASTIYNKILFARQDSKLEKALNTPEANLSIIATNITKLDDIKSSIDKAITQQADSTKRIEEKLQSLSDSNENLKQELVVAIQDQSGILKGFVEDFVKRINELFDKLGSSIETKMTNFGEESLSQSSKTIETLMERLSSTTEGLVKSQAKTAADSLEQTNKSLKALSDEMYDKLSCLISEMNNQSKLLSEAAERQSDALQTKMQDLQNSYIESSSSFMGQSEEMNKQLLASFTEQIQSFTNQTQQSISDVCSKLSDQVQTYLNGLKDNYEFLIEHTASITANYEQASESYIKAVEQAHQTNDAQERFLEGINQSVENLEQTNANIGSILSIIDARQEKTDKLVQRIGEMQAAIESLQKLENLLKRISAK